MFDTIKSMYVIPTSGAEHLVRGFEGQKGTKVILPGKNKDGLRVFPDGEVYTRLEQAEEIKGEKVVVLHSGQPDPNGGLVELEMLLEILRRAGVGQREVFFTYFPYGMQDKVFREGEVNAAESLLRKLVGYYGVSTVYAIDPHFHDDPWLADYNLKKVSAVSLLKEAALKDFPDMMFVAPDGGGQKRNDLSGLSKTRVDSHSVDHDHDDEFAASIKGKDVGVIDDLVETGGTLARFHEKCKEYGAKSVVALLTHGVLPVGIERVGKAYDKLYLSNTIDRPEANVDVSQLILEAIK